jgi:hypothetical protein
MLAGEALEHIRKLFLAALASSNNPDEMAVFIRHVSEGRLHCEVRVYFSPATAGVAEEVGAVACKKPVSADMGLLLGSEQDWSILDRNE